MLTQDEAEVYDRQIRLWGVNAQTRIRQSKVLMLGFNGVASEVAKILTLAGIDTLTIVDDSHLKPADLTSNLFCRQNDEATNDSTQRTHAVPLKLKKLNPLVKVNIKNCSISSIDADQINDYDLVTLHSFLTIDDTARINNLCRNSKIKFFIVLDYGFYGFVFNDLGDNFKYTFEDYMTVSNALVPTGQAKDPISLEENNSEEEPDADGDVGYGSSDDEDARPKKRRRIHSPSRSAHNKSDNEKKTQVGSLTYVPFSEMISMRYNCFGKHTSPVLLTTASLYKFYTEYGYLPRTESSVMLEDQEKLASLFKATVESLNLPEAVTKKLDPGWIDYIYGSYSPICAVLGGVAGQDVIRALSCKDIPLYNTFSFDGLSMNGTVEKVGVKSEQLEAVQPIVRDLLVIDDDED